MMAGAVKTMGLICGCIILFHVITAFLTRALGTWMPPAVEIGLSGLLELTSGCSRLPQLEAAGLRYCMASGFLAFGGLCVHLQLLGWAGRFGLPYPTFLACRAGAALLADGYCRGLLRLFPQPAALFSNISETLPRPGIGSTTLTALLLAGAVVFALDLLQRRRRVDWA